MFQSLDTAYICDGGKDFLKPATPSSLLANRPEQKGHTNIPI